MTEEEKLIERSRDFEERLVTAHFSFWSNSLECDLHFPLVLKSSSAMKIIAMYKCIHLSV